MVSQLVYKIPMALINMLKFLLNNIINKILESIRQDKEPAIHITLIFKLILGWQIFLQVEVNKLSIQQITWLSGKEIKTKVDLAQVTSLSTKEFLLYTIIRFILLNMGYYLRREIKSDSSILNWQRRIWLSKV